MAELTRDDARRWAALLPDEPRWVDTRGLLLCWPSTVIAGERDLGKGGGFVVVCTVEPLAAVVGRPGAAAIGRAVTGISTRAGDAPPELLAQPEDAAAVAAALPGWTPDGATLHLLGAAPDPPVLDGGLEIRLIGPDERGAVPAGEVSPGILRELTRTWERGRPSAVAFAGARVAGVCIPTLETERYWDVSIETLPAFRRRGVAAGCFAAVHAAFAGYGKRPVWGAHDSNPASLRLAARLGFRPACRLAAFVSPR